jgi:hypothetical protein
MLHYVSHLFFLHVMIKMEKFLFIINMVYCKILLNWKENIAQFISSYVSNVSGEMLSEEEFFLCYMSNNLVLQINH